MEPGLTSGTNTADAVTDGLSREQLEAKVKSMTQDLVLANAESEFFREQWQELRLRDEALGVEALTADQQKMEDKLVQAVKELYQSEIKRREAVQLLDQLLQTSQRLIKMAPNYDPSVRSDYEVAARSTQDYLAGRQEAAIPIGVSLLDGRIADISTDLNTVILNLGRKQGVKEGMSFAIFQENRQVGILKVVLAREMVSAALVDSLNSGVTLKVGDRASVNTQ